jgi:hypothetical protein
VRLIALIAAGIVMLAASAGGLKATAETTGQAGRTTQAAELTPQAYLPMVIDVWPLADVFAQVGSGQDFTFINLPGALTAQFVEDQACSHSGQAGLQINFGFTEAGNGGWGVHWNNAPGGHFDASRFATLTFWVKGMAPNGFHIGLKDTTEHEVKVEAKDYVIVNHAVWKQIAVSLSKFADARGPVNTASVRNVNVGFNRDHAAGSICIDEIAFQ